MRASSPLNGSGGVAPSDAQDALPDTRWGAAIGLLTCQATH